MDKGVIGNFFARFQVIVDGCEDVDFTTYFSDSESDDEWEDTKNTDKYEKDIGYKKDPLV